MNTNPCNKNASENVRKVLNYLNSIEGKFILTGQHTQTVLQEELDVVYRETGKLPAICGFELLSYSPNINWQDADEACLKEVRENQNTLPKVYDWVNKGGLVTLTWHWFSPLYGRNKSFYAEHTTFSAEKALIEGTDEHKAFCHDLDVMAGLLEDFNKKDIPILWRPFHESDGIWFWWGACGPKVAGELYKFMWHYFTDKYHLNNLIWVWNNPLKDAYVGDEYCDILSRDLYPPAHTKTDFGKQLKELQDFSSSRGLAAAEVGIIPDMDLLKPSETPWLWYMTWSKDFCLNESNNTFEQMRKMYSSPLAITLDKLNF